jgi:leucyl-tRNA---protein transferase
MKIFFSEFDSIYSTYTFAYAAYCIMEDQTELPDIYSKGFLPYTDMPWVQEDIFYMARSLRIDLELFHDKSENRRVARKVAPLEIELERHGKSDFDVADPDFLAFCLRYAEQRLGEFAMDEMRLGYVLQRRSLTDIFVFRSHSQVVGYVFAGIEADAAHYWYSFFDVAYMNEYSLGKWMMWRMIDWAKSNGLRYAYLGTCYERGALYKVQDHSGVEYFSGAGWNRDMGRLATLCKMDEVPDVPQRDLFKRESFILCE